MPYVSVDDRTVTGDSDGTWTGGLWVAQEGTDKLYEKRGEHLKDENN